jgi:hypothetical protein
MSRQARRQPAFLSVADAARAAGVSPDTVLRRVRAGEVRSKRIAGGRFLVDARDLEALRSRAAVVDVDVVLADHHSSAQSFAARTAELRAERIGDDELRPLLERAVATVERTTRSWPDRVVALTASRPAEDWRMVDSRCDSIPTLDRTGAVVHPGKRAWWILLTLLAPPLVDAPRVVSNCFTTALEDFRAALLAPPAPAPLPIPSTVEAARALVREHRAAFRRARVELRHARRRANVLAALDSALDRWAPHWLTWSRNELSEAIARGASAEEIRALAMARRDFAIKDVATLAGLLEETR